MSGLRSYSRVCLLLLSTVPFTVLYLLACHRHGDGALPYVARASSYFTSPNSTQRRGGRLSTLRSNSPPQLLPLRVVDDLHLVPKRLSKGSKYLKFFFLVRQSAGLSSPLIFLIAILCSCTNSWTHKYFNSMCRSFPNHAETPLPGGRRVCVNSDRHIPAQLFRQCLHRKRLCCARHDCIKLRLGRTEAPATLSTRPALDHYSSHDHQASGCALALLPVPGSIRVHIHVDHIRLGARLALPRHVQLAHKVPPQLLQLPPRPLCRPRHRLAQLLHAVLDVGAVHAQVVRPCSY